MDRIHTRFLSYKKDSYKDAVLQTGFNTGCSATDRIRIGWCATDRIHTDRIHTGCCAADRIHAGCSDTDRIHTDRIHTGYCATDRIYTRMLCYRQDAVLQTGFCATDETD